MMESFWGTMQLELLDSRTWRTRAELANAIFGLFVIERGGLTGTRSSASA